ncbi:DsbA family protein [Nanoarchaeota archaeon]
MAEKKEEKESEKLENIVAILVVLLVIFIVTGFWNNWWGWFAKDIAETNNPIVQTSVINEPVKGELSAPITIVEYSDFECPFCSKWVQDVYPGIEKQFIDTGKAAIVFKQFPLTKIHADALDAAIASECALIQGKFWEYHDLLFTNQDKLDDEGLVSLAEELELNMVQFNSCFTEKSTLEEVEADYSEGVQAGVTGTPAFIIGRTNLMVKGELIIGAQPYSVFEEVINRLS